MELTRPWDFRPGDLFGVPDRASSPVADEVLGSSMFVFLAEQLLIALKGVSCRSPEGNLQLPDEFNPRRAIPQ